MEQQQGIISGEMNKPSQGDIDGIKQAWPVVINMIGMDEFAQMFFADVKEKGAASAVGYAASELARKAVEAVPNLSVQATAALGMLIVGELIDFVRKAGGEINAQQAEEAMDLATTLFLQKAPEETQQQAAVLLQQQGQM